MSGVDSDRRLVNLPGSDANHLIDVRKALPHLVKIPLSNYGIDPFHCDSLPWGRLQLLSLDWTCLRMKFA